MDDLGHMELCSHRQLSDVCEESCVLVIDADRLKFPNGNEQ